MSGLLKFFSNLDVILFHFFNVALSNPVFDAAMPVITNTANWRPVAVVAALFWLWKGKNKGRWAVLIALVVWIAADQINANLVKPVFERPRPCWALSNVHLLVGCGNSFSFPSGHAATSFALATFLSLVYPRARWVLFALAGLISYSRIAVGVHYPFDTLGGMAEGAIFGFLFFFFFIRLGQLWRKKGWRGGW